MAEPATQNSASRQVPDKIGKYLIINEIGQGSTGFVYLSHDPYFRRDVAIKVYDLESDDDPKRAKIARKIFLRRYELHWPSFELIPTFLCDQAILCDKTPFATLLQMQNLLFDPNDSKKILSANSADAHSHSVDEEETEEIF